METIVAINAALALIEALSPQVAKLIQSGEITVAQQAEMLKRYTALRDNLKAKFTGPEWEA